MKVEGNIIGLPAYQHHFYMAKCGLLAMQYESLLFVPP